MDTKQNIINHVVITLDASISMRPHAATVVKVADELVTHLAQRSKDLDQETRVTVYLFGSPNNFRCAFYDKDVLRLPSLKGVYSATDGSTALIDAGIQTIEELKQTAQLHGDHAFLVYILTDGAENQSRQPATKLEGLVQLLPDNWTIACLVPNQSGVAAAGRFGLYPDNIAIWDTTSATGFEAVGHAVRQATDRFMTMRATGVRSTQGLFRPDTFTIEHAKEQLKPLHAGQYRLFPVDQDEAIAPFIERHLRIPYRIGMAYYQVTKSEIVQPQKGVAILDKRTHQLFTGDEARRALGMPNYDFRMSKGTSDLYDIFVQSTSVNRKLLAGTKLLVMS